MPMPEALARLVPPGTSPKKLALAGGLIFAALGVLAYDLVFWAGDDEAQASEPVDLDNDGYADEETPGAGAGSAVPGGFAPAQDPGASSTPLPDAVPPAAAANGSEPDWQALLEQLLDRAEAEGDTAARTITDLRLTGITAGPDGGLALIDGRCLRAGDAVPGTRYAVVEVLADRVLLRLSGRGEPVELVLEALGGG